MIVNERDAAYRELMAPLGTASLELLRARALQRRTDSKFLMSTEQLAIIAQAVADHYLLLRSGDRDRARYETLYFDTPDLRCFHDHRRGRRPRHKVRFRNYPDRELTYLEVKTKKNEYVTDKHRSKFGYLHNTLDESAIEFVGAHCDLPANALVPRVWTNFYRSTLVGIETLERVTVDTELELIRGGKTIDLPSVVIMEVKQAHFDARSPIMMAIRSCGRRAVSASKYCTANVMHSPELRFNRLKPAIRRVHQLAGRAFAPPGDAGQPVGVYR